MTIRRERCCLTEMAGTLSPSSLQHVFRVMNRDFNDAVKRGLIGFNPFSKSDKPRAPKRTHKVWIAEKAQTFLKYVERHRWFALSPWQYLPGYDVPNHPGFQRPHNRMPARWFQTGVSQKNDHVMVWVEKRCPRPSGRDMFFFGNSQNLRMTSMFRVLCVTSLLFIFGCTGQDTSALVDPSRGMSSDSGFAESRRLRPHHFADPSGGMSPDSGGDVAHASHQRTPVPLNRGAEVAAGFSDERHPLLNERATLTLTADWTPCRSGHTLQEGIHDPELFQRFRRLDVADEQRTYRVSNFFRLLPEKVEGVGHLWALDEAATLNLLHQFHAHPSLQLRAVARRGGPNGAFGILRAVSAEHLDIVFRIHAEFNVTPYSWFTPAYFSGRMLVNRETGMIDWFYLGLPADRPLNATLTVHTPQFVFFDIVRVDRMQLAAGDARLCRKIGWTDELPLEDAQDTLRSMFYKFVDIDWVPVKEALETARSKHKPILAVVLWGSLNDQSC